MLSGQKTNRLLGGEPRGLLLSSGRFRPVYGLLSQASVDVKIYLL